MSKKDTIERDESAATNLGICGLLCLFVGSLLLAGAYFGIHGLGWGLTAWAVAMLALSLAFFGDAEKKRALSNNTNGGENV